jgi:hypothetical protein
LFKKIKKQILSLVFSGIPIFVWQSCDPAFNKPRYPEFFFCFFNKCFPDILRYFIPVRFFNTTWSNNATAIFIWIFQQKMAPGNCPPTQLFFLHTDPACLMRKAEHLPDILHSIQILRTILSLANKSNSDICIFIWF